MITLNLNLKISKTEMHANNVIYKTFRAIFVFKIKLHFFLTDIFNYKIFLFFYILLKKYLHFFLKLNEVTFKLFFLALLNKKLKKLSSLFKIILPFFSKYY